MAIMRPKMFWPVIITASNGVIYYFDGASNGQATVAAGTYLSADDLATAVQTAINTGTNPLVGATVTIDDATGKFVFAWFSAFTMRWSVTTNSIYAILGEVAVNQVAVLSSGTYYATATYQHQNGWYAPVMVFDDDGGERDRSMDTMTLNVGGQTKFLTEVELTKRLVQFRWLPPEKTYLRFATSTYTNQALETFWADARARFRYWEDATVEGTYVDYVLDDDTMKRFKPKRQFRLKALYEMEMMFRGYVA